MELAIRTCAVCFRPANCHNFGVLSCDACKMFFKRTKLLNIVYTCKRNQQCLEQSFSCFRASYCRACRMAQCLKVGMQLNCVAEIKNQMDDTLKSILECLMYQDSKREKYLISNFTFENPTLREVVENANTVKILPRNPNYQMTSEDWCFFGALTATKFLLNLDFMRYLSSDDKIILLEKFTAKATLMFSALRAMRAKTDKMIKPDGNDFFAEFIAKWSDFSQDFKNRVKSLLVSRLIELKIKNEEFILLTVIFFCNPAISGLSEYARSVLSVHQKTYNSALTKYCLLTYQQNGPARLAELLSLCTVTNKCFDDVQYLYWIFHFHFHVDYKKLVTSVICKDF